MTRSLAALLLLPALALIACETTNGKDWSGGTLAKFSDAEKTCEGQAGNIEAEEARPEFFVACMAALGWTPNPGTPFATPQTAPDPA